VAVLFSQALTANAWQGLRLLLQWGSSGTSWGLRLSAHPIWMGFQPGEDCFVVPAQVSSSMRQSSLG